MFAAILGTLCAITAVQHVPCPAQASFLGEHPAKVVEAKIIEPDAITAAAVKAERDARIAAAGLEQPSLPRVLPYASAWNLARQSDRPLLIFGKTDGCEPCERMWIQTIEPLSESGALDDFLLTVVNAADSPQLAQSMQLGDFPQLIVYARREEWMLGDPENRAWRRWRLAKKTERADVVKFLQAIRRKCRLID